MGYWTLTVKLFDLYKLNAVSGPNLYENSSLLLDNGVISFLRLISYSEIILCNKLPSFSFLFFVFFCFWQFTEHVRYYSFCQAALGLVLAPKSSRVVGRDALDSQGDKFYVTIFSALSHTNIT